MGVADRDVWLMGMVDFVRVRTAEFAKHGLDENGRDPKKWTWDRFEKFSEEIVAAQDGQS